MKSEIDLLHDNDAMKSDSELDEQSSALLDAIQNGATLKDVHNVSDEVMDDVYKLAYEFYINGKLKDAESLFRFLCIYDFYNPEYAMGLAAVNQLKKNYTKAIDLYALAYSLAKDDYRPMFYAGQCNLMLRRAVQARKCFETVVSKCSDTQLIARSQSYLSALDEVDNSESDDSVRCVNRNS
ncbi:type III secretion system translocator chaperone SicA [Erwinia amylovora]|uniref:type III secretion system translocator chaperone SicA n=1 Tax=Erwinia amylovora TaxID=552 RepID=UPI000C073B36|nr:type III secretion system translocator chaperone SicA [Erwinia amylovora]